MALNFAAYESIKNYCFQRFPELIYKEDLLVPVKLTCGAVAGALAQTGV